MGSGSRASSNGRDDKADASAGPSYVSRLGDASKWAAGTLGGVAATAVTKLGLDRLGTGEVDPALVTWAFVGLGSFVIGVVFIIAAVVWHAGAGRVTIGYLLSGRRVPSKIRCLLDENKYLLGGAPNLMSFRTELSTLVLQLKTRRLTAGEHRRLRRLLDARKDILKTGGREQAREISKRAAFLTGVGAVLAALGAATFALATNRDVILRTDRLAQEARDREEIPTGTLLPKQATPVRIAVPDKERQLLEARLGDRCDLKAVDGILFEIDAPPRGAIPDLPDRTNVFHVVTNRSDRCAVEELWVPPNWISTPADTSPTAGKADAGAKKPGNAEDEPTDGGSPG